MTDLQARGAGGWLTGRLSDFLDGNRGTFGVGAYGISYSVSGGTKGIQIEGQATAFLMTVKGSYVATGVRRADQ
jgi:hypothetical protein